MSAAVEFYGEFGFVTVKINYEFTYRVLSAEFKTE